jgi:hypothetical protein
MNEACNTLTSGLSVDDNHESNAVVAVYTDSCSYSIGQLKKLP